MKNTILILIAATFFSCKSEKEKQFITFKKELTKAYNDEAFKRNHSINIMQLDILKVDTLSEAVIDTNTLIKYQNKIDYFLNMAELQQESIQNQIQMMRLTSGLDKTLFENSQAEYKKEKLKYDDLMDSVNYFMELDSVKRLTMKKSPKKNKIYQVKAFVKAQTIENKTNKTDNILDTMFYFFDRENKIINLNN